MQLATKCLTLPDRLPIEILQEVFFWCLPEGPSDGTYPDFWHRTTFTNPRHAPLLLCSVCKWWRDAALASPNLWTTMLVLVRSGVTVPAPNLVSVWLSRSGTLPLNLALHQQNESIDNRVAAGHILDIFNRCAPQWGDVHFVLFGSPYNHPPTAKGRAGPLLKRFELHTSHEMSEKEEMDLFSVFDHVPQLQCLHLSRIPDLGPFGCSSIPVPWGQLTHLTLEFVPMVGTALHILSMCLNLESCKMKIDTARGSLLHQPLHLPRLHLLSTNLGFETLPCFLDQLILPRLTDLAIYVRGPLERYSWAQEHFDAFLVRSNCHVQHLKIRDTGMSNLDFTACIQHSSLQTLVELVIDDTRGWTWDPFVTRSALDLLITRTPNSCTRNPENSCDNAATHSNPNFRASSSGFIQQKPCLPSLEQLVVRGNSLLSSDGIFADVVESRWKYHTKDVARLKAVEVELPIDHEEDTRRLKELQGEGLEVTLL